MKIDQVAKKLDEYFQELIAVDQQNRKQHLERMKKDINRCLMAVADAAKQGMGSHAATILSAVYTATEMVARFEKDWELRTPITIVRTMEKLTSCLKGVSDDDAEEHKIAAAQCVDEWFGFAADLEDEGELSDAESEYEIESGDYRRVWQFFGLQLTPDAEEEGDEADQWDSESDEEEFDSKWLKSSDEEDNAPAKPEARRRERTTRARQDKAEEAAATRPTIISNSDWDDRFNAFVKKARHQRSNPHTLITDLTAFVERTPSPYRRTLALLDTADLLLDAYHTARPMPHDLWLAAYRALDAVISLVNDEVVADAAADRSDRLVTGLETKIVQVAIALHRELANALRQTPPASAAAPALMADEPLLTYVMARVSALLEARLAAVEEEAVPRLKAARATFAEARLSALYAIPAPEYASMVSAAPDRVAQHRMRLVIPSTVATAPREYLNLPDPKDDGLDAQLPADLPTLVAAVAAHVIVDATATRLTVALQLAYHHAIATRYDEALSQLLLPAVQSAVAPATETQVLFNRTLVMVGLAAFRIGRFPDAAHLLGDLTSSPRFHDLMGQSAKPEDSAVPTPRHLSIPMVDAAAALAALVSDGPALALLASGQRTQANKVSRKLAHYITATGADLVPVAPDPTFVALVDAVRALMSGDVPAAVDAVDRVTPLWAEMPGAEGLDVPAMVTNAVRDTGIKIYLSANGPTYTAIAPARAARVIGVERDVMVAAIDGLVESGDIAGTWTDDKSSFVPAAAPHRGALEAIARDVKAIVEIRKQLSEMADVEEPEEN